MKILLQKGYALTWKAKAFVIKKVKNTELRAQVISGEEYLKYEEIAVIFYKKYLQKTSQIEFNPQSPHCFFKFLKKRRQFRCIGLLTSTLR